MLSRILPILIRNLLLKKNFQIWSIVEERSIFHWPLEKIAKRCLRIKFIESHPDSFRISNAGPISMTVPRSWWKQTGFHSPWHLPRNIAAESRKNSGRITSRYWKEEPASPIMDPSIGLERDTDVESPSICDHLLVNKHFALSFFFLTKFR